MSYPEALTYLYGLQKHGIKLGLKNIRTLAALLGDPHTAFRSVHVAGTNGKGSVASMTASILRACGYRVGLFTSPHLVSFAERIRVDDELISESDVVSLTGEIRDLIAGNAGEISAPTFFEFVTAIAFEYFRRKGVDWAVVEVGMGGRLDSTNIIAPEASVISRISYDHQAFLGDTLREIAAEKAGIIKAAVPVISASQDADAAEVIAAAAKERSAPLSVFGRDFEGRLKSSGVGGISFEYRDGEDTFDSLQVPLAGEHQLSNACLAVKAALTALRRAAAWQRQEEGKSGGKVPSDPHFLREGLSKVRWPGRLEFIEGDPPLLLDGAHNPDAARKLSSFVKKYLQDRRIILVAGIMADKEIRGILEPLLPVAAEIICTAPRYDRAAPPEKLAAIAASLGFASHRTRCIADAMALARGLCNARSTGRPLVLVTGSFFTVGEAKEILGEMPVLGDLREKL